MERRHADVVLGVYVGSVGDEQFNDLDASVKGGDVQWGPAEGISRIDVGPAGQEGPHFLQISANDGIGQRRLGDGEITVHDQCFGACLLVILLAASRQKQYQ